MFFTKHTSSVLVFLAILLLSACTIQGEFGPLSPTAEPMGTVANSPEAITFATLNEEPSAYIDHLLRVSGSYRQIEHNVSGCFPFKGPGATWALEADGFRMNISGFDRMVELAPDGAQITVDGVWHLYEGPVGCGKEPPTGKVWHLEVNRVVSPNPLIFSPVSFEPVAGGSSIETPLPTDSGEGDDTVIIPTPILPPATATPQSGYGGVDILATETAVSFSLTATAFSRGSESEQQTPTPSQTPTPLNSEGTDGTDETEGSDGTESLETPIPTRSSGVTTDTPTPSITPTLSTEEMTATSEAGGQDQLGSDGTGAVTQTVIAPTVTPTSEPYVYP